MKEHYYRWHTEHLSREFEMLEFGSGGVPVILFPTSKGRYFQNKDFHLVDTVADLITAKKVMLFCVDGIDGESFYNYSIAPADRLRTHNAYERLIVNDVIPRALKLTKQKRVITAGCSFGGYHALNLALRFPWLVSGVISMGGAFDIKQFIFGYYDDNCYFNNPPDYLPNLTDPKYLEPLSQLYIALGTGHDDSCRADNLKIHEILTAKKIPHLLDDRAGVGHDWPWWREMFPRFLNQILAKGKK